MIKFYRALRAAGWTPRQAFRATVDIWIIRERLIPKKLRRAYASRYDMLQKRK